MKLTKFSKSFQRVVMAVLLPSFAMVSGPVRANPAGPSGADVDAGNVAFQGLGTATVDINNFSQHAIINWESFSIQQGELARFNQGANAAVLNRVTTNNPTEIYGRLEASQGSVFLLNPNGILVGAGGVVDVAGMMTMSTLDVDDADFRNGGDMRFSGSSNTGVTNFGTISSTNGDVVLMGGFVDNKSGGQIGALNGTVAIGSGGDIILHEGGGTRISVRGSSDYEGTGIENQGEVKGASVEMKAHGNVYALAINNGGAVRATGANRSNGRVRLQASGGSSNINLGQSSNIVARAGIDGGDVEVKSVGGSVAVAGQIDARGTTEGGDILIAGNTVTQSAGSLVTATGAQAAGVVKVDADDSVELSGTLSAEGVHGSGGEVTVTANRIVINDGADLSANGATTGGLLRVGGDFQGRDTGLREANSVRVEAGAGLSADSLNGNAGTVVVWSNQDTIFVGDVSASARGAVGNGGMVEVSGKQFLYFDGNASVHSIGGSVGTVLFDPGDVVVGAAGPVPVSMFPDPIVPTVGSPPPLPQVQSSTVSIASVNAALQSGANVLIITESGNIFFDSVGGGGFIDGDGTAAQNAFANDRNSSIQWTNSNSSFGAFASGTIVVNNHIRTSGAGSINLLAGWGGSELGDFTGGVHNDTGLNLNTVGSVQGIWDYYIKEGEFGNAGGSIAVGSATMTRHVEVGSRFGDTNLAGFEIKVTGSDTNAQARYAQIGFHDGGQVFAPRLNRGIISGVSIALDLSRGVGVSGAPGSWYLSDGSNFSGQAFSGVGDPIAAVAGMFEVDLDNDGIVDGVNGINSSGQLTDTFIPYANHYNSASSGNWWWQQIDGAPGMADPLGLGGLRPEYGAGIGDLSTNTVAALALARPLLPAPALDGADINVIARSNVIVEAGADGQGTGAMIGHGGYNYNVASGLSFRENAAGVGAAGNVQNGTAERRWSFNGAEHERTGTAIARLAPVYGNINVFAGIDPTARIVVDHQLGTVAPEVPGTNMLTTGGNVTVQAEQIFGGAGSAPNSPAQIGHGGMGQFGEFYGDINVQAGRSINVLAGEGTRSAAVIGHGVQGGSSGSAYWNPTSQIDQQLRFFATLADYDNPNLRKGELFTGVASTGFDPNWQNTNPLTGDPLWNRRISLAKYTIENNGGVFSVVVANDNRGNYVPVINTATGANTGVWMNINETILGQPTLINADPLAYAGAHSTQGGAGSTTAAAPMGALGPLNVAPTSLVGLGVAAMDGSTVNGFHGDITVVANTGNIQVEGYMTQGVAGSAPRDRRFAQIGHGGTSASAGSIVGSSVTGAGYQNALAGQAVAPSNDGRDWGLYHTNGANGDQTGSRSEYGSAGSNRNRYIAFMTITGDIDVRANVGNIDLIAGNDIYDFAQIGHGGAELTDYETSSFVLGDVKVSAGGNINVVGGGGVQPVNRNGTGLTDTGHNYDLRAWAQIGHGGYVTGFLGYIGDISVNAGGNVLVQNGAHSFSWGKIGHQGISDYGQSGGSFLRDEMFRADRAETDIRSDLNEGSATVTYSSNVSATNLAGNLVPGDRAVVGTRDFTASGAGMLLESLQDDPDQDNGRNTANINVTAGGSVILDHMDMGERQPEFRLAWIAAANGITVQALRTNPNFLADSQTLGVRTANSFSMIGHGGINSDELFNVNNTATNFGDKIGNISVIANGVLPNSGDVSLSNGEGTQRWTRIGHGVGQNDGGSDGTNVGFSRAIELAGNITVSASRDIIIDASAAAADESDKIGNVGSANGSNPSRLNPVAIGHGGVDNNTDVVVLGRGENVNGIAASSNITASAGRDMKILAGNGTDASSAQLGHGHRSDNGNDFARRFGVPTGFAGDIDVTVGRDLLIQGGEKAWTETAATQAGLAASVHGAFAAIGHGGYMMDAPSFGEISVYVGNNLDIIAQVRTDPRATTTAFVANLYNIKNKQVGSDAVASAFNFAKIGHFSVENGDRTFNTGTNVGNFSDVVDNAGQTGDIKVVVGNDLTLRGGTINVDPLAFEEDDDALSNVDTHTIYGAFAQIGHGGPGIGGDLIGNITVLVDGNISVVQGANTGIPGVDSIVDTTTGNPSQAMNNYAMIGNGDYIYGTRPIPSASDLFRRHAQGFRIGNIVVAAGNNATFDGALIGHADPQFASAIQSTFGDTRVAAGRNFPFYGGAANTGELTARNGTIFSSGGYGATGTRMELYAASRSKNKLNATTRINEATATFVAAPGDFVGLTPANGKLAGREDEVYLTPDLWWDDLGTAAAAGIPGGAGFPTSATAAGQGGSIANVTTPGGLPNLTALTTGALGASADIYRIGNGVSGAGFYTLYYDAIEFISNVPPTPPAPPFTGTLPGDFDNFDRQDDIYDDGLGGGGYFSGLGIFRFDEQEDSRVSRFEDAIDNAFGPRRDSTSEEEDDEERRRRERRAAESTGPIGLTFYTYDPATNTLSSYRVFGTPSESTTSPPPANVPSGL